MDRAAAAMRMCACSSCLSRSCPLGRRHNPKQHSQRRDHMSGSSHAKKRRVLGVMAVCTAAVVALSGCAGGSSAPAADTGSADSGSIDWWGWTPDDAPAQTYIKAFNQVYPNIKVTYKKLTIDGYDAALRPALASSVGPDVFDVAPGAANGSVNVYGVNAVDMTPAV